MHDAEHHDYALDGMGTNLTGKTSIAASTAICRRLRCDLGPETSTNTAHQLQGELAIPVPRYRHPHATNNGACSRDAPGPTNSLPLHPRVGAPLAPLGRAAPSPLLWASARFRRRARKRVTGMALPCAHNGTPAPAPRARARTTRHARTCNGATVE